MAKENLGNSLGLIAASGLLIDYILTVAVSTSAGIAALTSAFEDLAPYRVELALGGAVHPHGGQPARGAGDGPGVHHADPVLHRDHGHHAGRGAGKVVE